MSGNRRNRMLPITGIVTGIILIVAIILAFLVSGYRKADSGRYSTAEAETESEVSAEMSAESENRSVPKLVTVTEAGSEQEEDSDTGENDPVIVVGEVQTDSSEPDAETETEAETEAEKLVVAIDPGHQGSWVDMTDTEPVGPGSTEMKTKSSTGTQGRYSGVPEYELNLQISLLLRTELEARGYEVILTREDNDTAISNAERATLAYEQGGDIYVRIHANGSDDSSVNGALGMVPSSSNPYVGYLAEDSYLLAECILDSYCSTAGFNSLGIQYYDNMTGINWSKIPVMILEMGFMTNESDDLRMQDSSVQALMVQGIADGIDEYFTRKGMKTDSSSKEEETESDSIADSETASDTEITASNEALEKMSALIEALGEEYLYPSIEKGESWAVSVKSLDENAEGDINGDVQMKSASILKVFIMATVYDRVFYPSSEDRRIEAEEIYDGELKELISDMITVSDNTASNTLVKRLGNGDAQTGMAVVNQYLQENGYTGTSMGRLFLEENPSGDNYTTANDCRTLLERIYNGTCVGEEASAEMYEYLKKQTATTKIPAALTDTTASVANKTGELAGDYSDYVENDIAIVEDGDHAYVLCVLSGDLQSNSAAITQIVQISSLVYDTLMR